MFISCHLQLLSPCLSPCLLRHYHRGEELLPLGVRPLALVTYGKLKYAYTRIYDYFILFFYSRTFFLNLPFLIFLTIFVLLSLFLSTWYYLLVCIVLCCVWCCFLLTIILIHFSCLQVAFSMASDCSAVDNRSCTFVLFLENFSPKI